MLNSLRVRMVVIMVAIIAITSMTFIFLSRKEIHQAMIASEEAGMKNILRLAHLTIENSYKNICMINKAGTKFYSNKGKNELVQLTRSSRIQNIYNQFPNCSISEKEIERQLAAMLDELQYSFFKIRIAKTGYLFLFNEDKKMLIHPLLSSGTDAAHLKNPETGQFILREMILAAKTQQPFKYIWDRPGDEGNHTFRKIAYISFFEPLGWYVGVCLYTDEVLQASDQLREKLFFLSIGFFVVSIMMALLYANTLIVPIRELAWATESIRHKGLAGAQVPVTGTRETRALGRIFNELLSDLQTSHLLTTQLNKDLDEYNKTLEFKVSERTKTLNNTLGEVEEANRKIMSSIRYAKMIQASLLTNPETVRRYIPKSFFIWRPRDVVGGDIFYADAVGKGFVIAVIDCTGHGVPGAFMTMIASSALRRIVKDESCYDPAEILKRLNFIVKTTLQQDTDYASSDDGLDAAICSVSAPDGTGERVLIFAGARLPLFYTRNGIVHVVKGDRHSIGYKSSRKSNMDFNFTDHTIQFKQDMSFYMVTDGFIDQLGGEKERRFGTRRFKNLIQENWSKHFEEQKSLFLLAFKEYKGKNEVQDDITVIGFGL